MCPAPFEGPRGTNACRMALAKLWDTARRTRSGNVKLTVGCILVAVGEGAVPPRRTDIRPECWTKVSEQLGVLLLHVSDQLFAIIAERISDALIEH